MTAAGCPTAEAVAPLPPALAAELIELLAAALVADYRQYPNLAESLKRRDATV